MSVVEFITTAKKKISQFLYGCKNNVFTSSVGCKIIFNLKQKNDGTLFLIYRSLIYFICNCRVNHYPAINEGWACLCPFLKTFYLVALSTITQLQVALKSVNCNMIGLSSFKTLMNLAL